MVCPVQLTASTSRALPGLNQRVHKPSVTSARPALSTVTRANGLESFARISTDHDINQTSIETAILSYSKDRCPFSGSGDSGSIILDRAGRIVALLTGGCGLTDGMDTTYGTPYWWLEEQIMKACPTCHLCQVVARFVYLLHPS